MLESDGWCLVANRRGERVFAQRYKTHRERIKVECAVIDLLGIPGYRWVRGKTEEECVELMKLQTHGGNGNAGVHR